MNSRQQQTLEHKSHADTNYSDALLVELCQEIAAAIPTHTYPPNVELLRQGMLPEEVFCIRSGIVKLSRLELDGRGLIVDLRFAGRLLGAASVIIKEPHPVTAVTLTPCSLRCIPAGLFRQLVRAKPGLSWYLHQMQSREVFDHVERVAQLGCCHARHRLERLLCQLIEAHEQGLTDRETRFQLPLKHWEVAELIATTPPYLCQLFNELEAEGVLQRRKGWIVVPDPRRLRCGSWAEPEPRPSSSRSCS